MVRTIKQALSRRLRFCLAIALAGSPLAIPSAGWAQSNAGLEEGPDEPEPGYSSLKVQPPKGAGELQRALQRLAQNGRDVDALIDAGNAALLLGDAPAAAGFFARAEELGPTNPRIKAGLGSALLLAENPREALRHYNEALQLGLPESAIAADRGLALDLMGQSEAAQADYLVALRRGGDDETIRRYALSLAISGDPRGAEAQLDPLLRKRDAAAWRVRAFALAISGDVRGAQAIADATMPARMASAIAPYLKIMPRLSPGQQAAAAHFGYFPAGADIGKRDPLINQAGGLAPPSRSLRADAGLIPAGEPLGPAQANDARSQARSSRETRRRPGKASRGQEGTPAPTTVQVASAAPVAAPPQPLVAASASPPLPSPSPQRPSELKPSAPVPQTAAIQGPVDPGKIGAGQSVAKPAPAPVQSAPQNTPVRQVAAAAAIPPQPTSQPPVVAPPPAQKIDLAAVMATVSVPKEELQPDPEAVDLSRIAAAQPKPKPKPKPVKAAPVHPSRVWVQVAGGANRADLPREWKRLTTAEPAVFKGKQGWWTPVGQSNRLLAGPFSNAREAQTFVNALTKAGLSGFAVTSNEGQEVFRIGK